VGIKMLTPSEEMARTHYDDLKAKPFFPALIRYFSSGPIVAMVWQGKDVVSQGRVLIGATNPRVAIPGTIRGDFCIDTGRNIIHGSDATNSAEHEIGTWFRAEEVSDWDCANNGWVYE